MINAELIWSGWPDWGTWPSGGRKNLFLKLVKMDAICFIKILMESSFFLSAWSGAHYGEAGRGQGRARRGCEDDKNVLIIHGKYNIAVAFGVLCTPHPPLRILTRLLRILLCGMHGPGRDHDPIP